MNKLSIRDLDLKGKRVFIRVDFNVPLDGGKVGDDTRIRETLPTLQLAMSRGARLVLASHLGRPKGKVDPKYSLAPVAARLQELLGKPVAFVADCVGAEAEAKTKSLRDGEVLLLENVRFHPEEEANDPAICEAACRAVRWAVRVRRVWLGASCACLRGGHHEVRAPGCGRSADGKGAGVSRQSHLESRPAVRLRAGRRESLRQNRSGAESDEARRRDADRRRDGVHIS